MQITSNCNQRRTIRLIALFITLVTSLSVLANTCNDASVAYKAAMLQQESETKLDELKAINGYCPHPLVYFAIAEAYVDLGRLDQAKKSLMLSKQLVEKSLVQANKMLPMISGMRAKIAVKESDLCLAKSHYNQAINRLGEDRSLDWLKEVELEIELFRSQHVLSADEIRCQLEGSKAIGVVARVSLSVSFGYDSATLTEAGITQVSELAKAIRQSTSASDEVTLVGHTDSQGGENYNLELSLQRAKSVKQSLMKDLGDEYRLLVMGKGERELLSHEQTQDAHQLNRRVEVVIGP